MSDMVSHESWTILSALNDIESEKLVLPDFQRDYVWKREDVRQLLQSIVNGYYIGTILTLQDNPQSPLLSYRRFEGAGGKQGQRPHIVQVLDGQQRLTSLLYAMRHPKGLKLADSKKKPVFFYVDLFAMRDGKTDETVVAAVENSEEHKDYEDKARNGLAIAVHSPTPYDDCIEKVKPNSELWTPEFIEQAKLATKRLHDYAVSVLRLTPQGASLDELATTFTKINSTGQRLTVFDLCVAYMLPHGVNLRNLADEYESDARQELVSICEPEHILRIAAMCMPEGDQRTGKLLRTILANTPEFQVHWSKAVRGAKEAFKLLEYRLGGCKGHFLASRAMFQTLAAVMAQRPYSADLEAKLVRWYWAAAANMSFANSADSQALNGYRALLGWIDNSDRVPPDVNQLRLSSEQLADSDRKSDGILFKATCALIWSNDPKDPFSGASLVLSGKEDDHLFPANLSKQYGQRLESVANVAFLTKETNSKKGSIAPSNFIKNSGQPLDVIKARFEAQFVPPEAVDMIVNDDFESFLKARSECLVEAIKVRVNGEA